MSDHEIDVTYWNGKGVHVNVFHNAYEEVVVRIVHSAGDDAISSDTSLTLGGDALEKLAVFFHTNYTPEGKRR